jgi:hypothetical protein
MLADPSVQLVLVGLFLVGMAELYRPWNKPNPHDRNDHVKFWGVESWRLTAVAVSYGRRPGLALAAAGVVLGLVRFFLWVLSAASGLG